MKEAKVAVNKKATLDKNEHHPVLRIAEEERSAVGHAEGTQHKAQQRIATAAFFNTLANYWNEAMDREELLFLFLPSFW